MWAILKKKQVQLQSFRSVVGQLRHAARILPTTRGSFIPLDNVGKYTSDSIGLSSLGEVRHALQETVLEAKLEQDIQTVIGLDIAPAIAGGPSLFHSALQCLEGPVWFHRPE